MPSRWQLNIKFPIKVKICLINRSVKPIKENNNLCRALLTGILMQRFCRRAFVGALLSARFCRRAFVLRANDGVSLKTEQLPKEIFPIL